MAIFTQYKFALVWSIVVMLSYFAYSNPEFKANPVLQVAEYVCVYLVLIVEIWRNWSQPNEASPVGIQFKEFFKNKTN
jgi:alpha-1,6-mannosyltransferase